MLDPSSDLERAMVREADDAEGTLRQHAPGEPSVDAASPLTVPWRQASQTTDDLLGQGAFEYASRLLGLADAGLALLGPSLEVLAASTSATRMIGPRLENLAAPPDGARWEAEFRERVFHTRRNGTDEVIDWVTSDDADEHGACELRCVALGAGFALVVRTIGDGKVAQRAHPTPIGTTRIGVIITDETGRITSADSGVMQLLGYAPSELVRMPVSDLIDHAVAPAYDGNPERGLRVRVVLGVDGEQEVVARCKDGSSVPMRLAVGRLDAAGQHFVTWTLILREDPQSHASEIHDAGTNSTALAEQVALRGVATAVASGLGYRAICDLVAREVAENLGAGVGLVCRFGEQGAHIVGRWSLGAEITDTTLPLTGGGALVRVAQTGRPARVDDYDALRDDPTPLTFGHSLSAGVAAPITGPEGVWGAVFAGATTAGPLADHAEDRLASFAELVGMAIATASERERLIRLALEDPLTGLVNHRVFHDRLAEEVARAARHSHALALVLVDLDGFKRINDRFGHPAGDLVLAEVARCLERATREGDVLARLGGNEFAWLLPNSDLVGAHTVAERVRAAVADRPIAGVGQVTVSLGVCDQTRARDGQELLAHADRALYWAKHQGRDRVCDCLPSLDAASEMSPELASGSDTVNVLAGAYALSRAVDAKDPSTREHSLRVARMAVLLAGELEWSGDRLAQLHETGLLHDVGKIGIPDAILFKPGSLSPSEYEIVKAHAELGQHIIEGVVTDEQGLWVRHHHERWDGSGYPDGLVGEQIPDGARILAVADGWDVMTSHRPYRAALDIDQAVAECWRHAGTQFCPEVIGALERLWTAGSLPERCRQSIPWDPTSGT